MSNEDDDEWWNDNDEWLDDDERDNDEFWEEADCKSELMEVYDSPEDALIDMCHAPGVIADFAPPHAVFEFLTTAIEKLGHDPKAAEGRRILLAVAQEVFPHPSPLEHNAWLACFHCPNEVLPVIDTAFLERFFRWWLGQIELTEFYRCPDCGAPFSASKTRREPGRHLPWYHYEHGDDFDVPDEELPKA